MPSVERKHPKESFEAMFRRFKRAVEKADIVKEVRKREFYEKPSQVRKRKKAAAVKRTQRDFEKNSLAGGTKKRNY